MKKKILMISTVLLLFAGQTLAGSVGILSVGVTPVQPSNTDLITFNIFGWASESSSWVDHDAFAQNGTSLQLDLYVDMGIGRTVSEWTHSKQIQPLLPATYNLEVRAFENDSGTLWDTYNMDFTVTPEPSTIALFSFGLPFFRGFLKRKI